MGPSGCGDTAIEADQDPAGWTVREPAASVGSRRGRLQKVQSLKTGLVRAVVSRTSHTVGPQALG